MIQTKSKKEQIRQMFDNIAGTYDFLNHFLSLGIDRIWRRRVIKIISKYPHNKILDIATGTGDLAIEASRLTPQNITGIDISPEMINLLKNKISKKGLENIITPMVADGENIPCESGSFNVVMISFGIRNFEDVKKGLTEIYRVLNQNGLAIILEFSNPENFPVKQIYNLYFRKILPFIGKIVSKNKQAYKYLPESVNIFPAGQAFIDLLKTAGFSKIKCTPLSCGIVSIYTAEK